MKPTIQNIPIRTLEGTRIRDLFRRLRPLPDLDYESLEWDLLKKQDKP